MNYKQLTLEKKAQIDLLLETGHSMRAAAKILNISHSTISRYKNNIYTKREINIQDKYPDFLLYLNKYYDPKVKSIEVCINQFKKYNIGKKYPSYQQVYNWINKGIIDIKPEQMCYKRHKRKRKITSGMVNHYLWNLKNKTVLPISLRPRYISDRDEIGHLEIDSIIGKRNEVCSVISIVDRVTRMVWLIKANARNEYYTSKIIREFIQANNITVKSITVDNGSEFKAMGIAAKRLGVKLYLCDPYCSFQRGSNEHANGIVRRFIPKGLSLWNYEQQYLDDIADKINNMPRKIFDFKSAYEVELKYI